LGTLIDESAGALARILDVADLGVQMRDLRRELIDVDIDHVCCRIKRQIPDVLNDHRPCDFSTCIAHQEFEKSKLPSGQFNFSAGPLDLPLNAVEFQIGNSQHRFGGNTASAHRARIRAESSLNEKGLPK